MKFATNIMWDTESLNGIEYESVEDNLPTRVEIPSDVESDDEIADYLSDKFGYCVIAFDIEVVNS
jgi:hypothetical protein